MARRWNKFKSRPEYGHLYGTSPDLILNCAIRSRPYGQGLRLYPFEANRSLLDLYGSRASLSMADLRAGIDVARGARRWSTEFTLDFIGNLIGWGVHLGILLETQDPAGSPVWTLRSREMRYGVLGGRAVQVRDLEPEAQARIERKLRAQAKLNATLDARHSEKVAPEIRQLLADIVLADTGARIPEGWGVYVPADIREQWPRIGDAMGILVDLHRDWDRGLQARWVERVREERRDALVRAAVRKEETEALEAQILADDDAFATLGDL